MSTTRKARATAEEATNTANAAMNDGIERMTQGLTQFGSFGQENIEAMIECATTVAKGFEKIANENATYAKKQMETGTDRFQALSKAKTPQEFFEAQNDLLRTSMESHIGQMNKVSDMWMSTARDAAQPLSKRYSAMVEMMQQR
ncbi:phasin family protein [Parvularcula sp. LCG005]|uniref:phasin family protein n=1 Tax=Parvularcula sp. LCG005 TaxID=3078805 RepID=UPI0029429FF2|nr:phasin family protein [Parvularcula sp. LCG005]WOI52562.1 phasin family protein [Parvularcula sp. LCG005]